VLLIEIDDSPWAANQPGPDQRRLPKKSALIYVSSPPSNGSSTAR
jgi:hypothetical protein